MKTITILALIALFALPAAADDPPPSRLPADFQTYSDSLHDVGCYSQETDAAASWNRFQIDLKRETQHFTEHSNDILRRDLENLETHVDNSAESCVAQLVARATDSSDQSAAAAAAMTQECDKIESAQSDVDTDIQDELDRTESND